MKKAQGYIFCRSDVLLITISMFSFFTITQNLYPISINRVLVAFLAITLCIRNKYRKLTMRVVLYMLILLIYTCGVSKDISLNIKDYIYYFVAVLMLLEFGNNNAIMELKKAYLKKESIIDKITFLNFVIILIELVMPMCYSTQWGERYFCGLTDTAHTMAAGLCLNLTFMLLYFEKIKFKLTNLIILGIYLIAIFSTGARIFLIPCAILIYNYVSKKIGNKLVKRVFYGFAIIMFIVAFLKTGMYDKFMYAINDPYGNSSSFLESFTSGRSVFWLVDLKDYFESNFLQQVFGHGFDYIYRLNLSKVGMEIWAHNDFINLLISVGLIGFMIYVIALWKMFSNLRYSLKIKEYILIVSYVAIPALLNGFYTYAHYMFSFYIFMLIIMNNKKNQYSNH